MRPLDWLKFLFCRRPGPAPDVAEQLEQQLAEEVEKVHQSSERLKDETQARIKQSRKSVDDLLSLADNTLQSINKRDARR